MSKNWELFSDWALGQPCTFFIPFLSENVDDFNFRALGRAANMPEAGIRQNSKCREYLKGIQQELIALGHMVAKNDAESLAGEDSDKPVVSKKGELANPERIDYERLKEEVIRLNEELRDMKAALMRFGKMEQYLMEFGVLPR
ncbi:MAG: hypothetical protein IPQ16_06605 [Geobacteraceae bacterium]|nr:hypothetical protein [Geobacteraceae bacterium]